MVKKSHNDPLTSINSPMENPKVSEVSRSTRRFGCVFFHGNSPRHPNPPRKIFWVVQVPSQQVALDLGMSMCFPSFSSEVAPSSL